MVICEFPENHVSCVYGFTEEMRKETEKLLSDVTLSNLQVVKESMKMHKDLLNESVGGEDSSLRFWMVRRLNFSFVTSC